jgi:hypothetical protein
LPAGERRQIRRNRLPMAITHLLNEGAQKAVFPRGEFVPRVGVGIGRNQSRERERELARGVQGH